MAVHMSPNTTVPAETARVARAVFPKGNAVRAGVEGTLTQGTRVCGLRRARYMAKPRRISNISSRPWSSIWPGLWRGYRACRWRPRGLPPLLPWPKVEHGVFQQYHEVAGCLAGR